MTKKLPKSAANREAIVSTPDGETPAGDPELAALYREHLVETEGHERRTRNALAARGVRPSRTNR